MPTVKILGPFREHSSTATIGSAIVAVSPTSTAKIKPYKFHEALYIITVT